MQSVPDCRLDGETGKDFRQAVSLLARSEREQAPGLLAKGTVPVQGALMRRL